MTDTEITKLAGSTYDDYTNAKDYICANVIRNRPIFTNEVYDMLNKQSTSLFYSENQYHITSNGYVPNFNKCVAFGTKKEAKLYDTLFEFNYEHNEIMTIIKLISKK